MIRKSIIIFIVIFILFSSQVMAEETVLNFATSSEVVGLSPVLTNDSASSDVLCQVYDTLFQRDPKTNKIVPNLAVSYTNPDPETWVIKLREGVKFHDGTPFNAEAVKFTFDRIADPKVAAPRASLMEPIKSISVKDEYTIVMKTKYPYGPFLATLTHSNSAIVSPAAVKKYGDLMQHAVGTGPFIVDEWVSGDHITIVKNEDYWGNEVKLDKVVYKIIPEPATRIAMLETGEVEFLDQIPPEHLDRLKANPEVNVRTVQGSPLRYLGFNFKREEFHNEALRKAVACVVDQDAIVSTLNGLGYKSYGIIGPKVFGYKEEVEDYGYDYNLEKAKEYLKEAGYPDGFETTIWTTSHTTAYKRIGQIVQAELKKIGVDADLKILEWGNYLSITKKGEQDLFLLGWSNLTGDGSELIYPNLHSNNIGGANRTFYEGADELIASTRTTINQEERLKLLNKANKFLTEKAVWIPLFHQSVVTAARKNVKNLLIKPNGEWDLKDVELVK